MARRRSGVHAEAPRATPRGARQAVGAERATANRVRQPINHPAFGNVNVEETLLPDDPDGQVAATIAMMRRYAVEDSASPAVIADAQEAVGGSGDGLTQRRKAALVFHYVRNRLSFVEDTALSAPTGLERPGDPPIVEVLVRPRDMSVMGKGSGQRRLGDCDDYSMYVASLLLALGVRSSFVTVAADGREPRRFSHVYVAAYPDGERLAIDASHGSYPGWETSNVYRVQEWPVEDGSGMLLLAAAAALAAVVWKGRPPSWLQ